MRLHVITTFAFFVADAAVAQCNAALHVALATVMCLVDIHCCIHQRRTTNVMHVLAAATDRGLSM